MMGKKKEISLGGGKSVTCDFEEFFQRLSKAGQIGAKEEKLLQDNYSVEYQRYRERENARKRWDSWFAVENQTDGRMSKWREVTGDKFAYSFNSGLPVVIHQAKDALFHKNAYGGNAYMLSGKPRNNVSTFSGWIFNLHHHSSASRQSEGKVGELLVQNAKRNYPKPRVAPGQWVALFIDDLSGKQPGKSISSLTLNGKPMVGKPDYVFLNRQERVAIVVEIKTSDADPKPDGWPNLRAQLWAYAHLDIVVKEADRVILIGEIWGKNSDGEVTLRRTYRWEFPDVLFDRANQQLFDLYREYASY